MALQVFMQVTIYALVVVIVIMQMYTSYLNRKYADAIKCLKTYERYVMEVACFASNDYELGTQTQWLVYYCPRCKEVHRYENANFVRYVKIESYGRVKIKCKWCKHTLRFKPTTKKGYDEYAIRLH